MQELNKTIVVTYDDISRMKEFCANNEGVVNREFMDWYINENSFFSKTGVLIIENIFDKSDQKFTVAFDFNNPDYPEFVLYKYETQQEVCRYFFNREDNLAMKDISVDIKWFDKKAFESQKNIFSSPEINEDIRKFKHRTARPLGVKSRKQLITEKNRLENELDKIYSKICRFMAEQGVYMSYATMYYFAKHKAEEIIGINETSLLENGVGKQIKAIYKYTGYVNINEAKIYKPLIKKDKNEPTREYGRHIEKWSVRGHYRRINGKLIWIEPFEKGKGALEKRIYGTEDEKDLNLIPKVFEVMRTVHEAKEENTEGPPDTPIIEPVYIELVKMKEKSQPKERSNFWEAIKNFFFKRFHIKHLH